MTEELLGSYWDNSIHKPRVHVLSSRSVLGFCTEELTGPANEACAQERGQQVSVLTCWEVLRLPWGW